MLSPQQLAKQLDQAIEETHAIEGQLQGDLLGDSLDPHEAEETNHIEALLRFPQALEAIQHITEGSRQFLKHFLLGVSEFSIIFDNIEEPQK